MKEALLSVKTNVEIEIELSEKIRELAKSKIDTSGLKKKLEQEHEMRTNLKKDLKMLKYINRLFNL